MTSDEAKESLGEVITIKAPGTGKGHKQVEVYKIDVHEKTSWGRGTIRFVDLSDPKRRKICCCLTQVELHNSNTDRNSNGKRRRRKEAASETQTQTTRKRQRKSKRKLRRRRS
jgi:hypothetical protein